MTAPTVKRLFSRAGDAGPGICLLLTLLLIVAVTLAPACALAETPVHVTPSVPDPDSCALCHRGHSANAQMQYMTGSSTEPTGGSALIVSPTPARGDVGLCYLCHGVAALGASTDVETSMTLSSVHRVAPSESPTFGPNPKMCSSCHDSHGTARRVDGTPFPALLRAWTSAQVAVTTGEEYCDACHQGRAAAGSRYDSLATYRQTSHFGAMLPAVSPTAIRCLNCHVGHGSPIAPLIAGQVKPPAVFGSLATQTVTANDRTFCEKCHLADLGTWANSVAYDQSLHAQSTALRTIPGEWPALGSTRKIGECQTCHAPMGRSDGSGVIPNLGEKRGRQLCDECHQAAGPSTKDLMSLAYPSTESAQLELAVVYGPPVQTEAARVALYDRDPAAVNSLLGPREYRAADASATAATGDVDGDGEAELVVAKPGADALTVYKRDPLLGIATPSLWNVSVPITPDFITVGRFYGAPGRDQIAVVDGTTGEIAIYNFGVSDYTLLSVWSDTLPAGAEPTGLASGDVTSTAVSGLADLVITDTATDKVHVYADDGLTMARTSFDAKLDPQGPSVGDVWDAPGNEIVVCNPSESTATVSVFDAGGTRVDYTADNGGGDAVPVASTVADVLWNGVGGAGRAEVCVALKSATGTGWLNVFVQEDPGGGLSATPYPYDTGVMYGSGSIAAGDLNGDGHPELVVGNGGSWATATAMAGPSIQTFAWTTGSPFFAPAQSLCVGGGSEIAGRAPALAIADFGAVLPSRHPIDEVAATSHNSTETAPFTRHVTCGDCHNPHEANATAPGAPNIEGQLLGSWGITAANLAGTTDRSLYQYETCFKCHSSHVTLGSRQDIAAEVAVTNPSVHAVEASSTTSVARIGTFVSPWTNDSIVYCSDCHGDSVTTEAKGVHRSAASPILVAPLLGVGPGTAEALCYDCHKYALYRDGTGDSAGAGSRFRLIPPSPDLPLHRRHSGAYTGAADTGLEIGCLACHVSHGSTTQPHLMRDDPGVGYTHVAPNAGSCTNACHGGATKTYPN